MPFRLVKSGRDHSWDANSLASRRREFTVPPELADTQPHSCCRSFGSAARGSRAGRNLVDPASSHMLVSKIKPCMSQYKLLYGETANGSLKQL